MSRLNGAALIGQPKVLGQVVLGLQDDGIVGLLHSDFEPLMTNLILDKAKMRVVQALKIGTEIHVAPPKEDRST